MKKIALEEKAHKGHKDGEKNAVFKSRFSSFSTSFVFRSSTKQNISVTDNLRAI